MKRTNQRILMTEMKPPWPMTAVIRRKCRNGLSGRWQPRSGHKLIGRCCDQKVSILARAADRRSAGPKFREGLEA